MVCDTLPSQDAYTHQIWNSYLKEYKRYVLDTLILKTWSVVKVKVTVTRKWLVTLRHPKMHLHIEFGIPISKNRRYAPSSMQFLETMSEVKCKVTVTQLWYVTLCHSKMHPYAKFLETMSEVKCKVTVTQLWYVTLCHSKMHPYAKFEIPTLNNIRDMLRT